jgi:hypothetical protein
MWGRFDIKIQFKNKNNKSKNKIKNIEKIKK